MNGKIEIQPIKSEQRRKFTEELKIRTKGLIGRPVNEKSKNEFTKMVKQTKGKEWNKSLTAKIRQKHILKISNYINFQISLFCKNLIIYKKL